MQVRLLLALLLAFLSGFIVGSYYGVHSSSPTVSVYAVAVTSDGDGTLATITARLVPGFGRVFVSVIPKTEIDTQRSAEIAVHVAQILAGVPLGFRDVLFEIRTPSAIVEGPSAGAAMTVAAYALLTGRRPRKDVVITGTIEMDGSIGPVGGLLQKLKAAAAHHISYFLVPRGQRYYEYLEPQEKVYRVGGVAIVERYYVRRRVDLAALGRELGVHVIEVGHIREALPYFFKSEPSS